MPHVQYCQHGCAPKGDDPTLIQLCKPESSSLKEHTEVLWGIHGTQTLQHYGPLSTK